MQWGGNGASRRSSATPTGLAFPNTVAGGGAIRSTARRAKPPSIFQREVNLPAAIGQGATGGGLASS